MKKFQYRIICDTSLNDFENMIDCLMASGWRCVGGLSTQIVKNQIVFYQALKKSNASSELSEAERIEKINANPNAFNPLAK